MSFNLQMVAIIFILFLLLTIFYILVKGRINVKYSLVWLFSCTVLLIFTIFPRLLGFITKLLGFNVGSNMVIAALIGVLMLINISFTVIISGQTKKINLLIQELSILKEKVK